MIIDKFICFLCARWSSLCAAARQSSCALYLMNMHEVGRPPRSIGWERKYDSATLSMTEERVTRLAPPSPPPPPPPPALSSLSFLFLFFVGFLFCFCLFCAVVVFAGCFRPQQHASVSQGRICLQTCTY